MRRRKKRRRKTKETKNKTNHLLLEHRGGDVGRSLVLVLPSAA
jgi:hypothetical protein